MKVITVCGSMKFKEKILKVSNELALKGYCVLQPVYSINKNIIRTDDEHKMLEKEHQKRIDMSDAIYVVNVDNYIGKHTRMEINYAIKNNKEIIYYVNE